MSPGVMFALGPWLACVLWLAWEFWRAPVIDDEPDLLTVDPLDWLEFAFEYFPAFDPETGQWVTA